MEFGEHHMTSQMLGDMLILANPTANSGRGEGAAIFATRFFSSFGSVANTCEVRLTEASGDAERMASQAREYQTVVALGGDGIIHEVVNGLMSIPEKVRPKLGVIPMGSGNDFARTIGMTRNDPEKSIAELLGGHVRDMDLGRVNDTYFMQTLSFGLDAAIALDTTERRASNSRQTGSLLFVTSGIKIVATGLRGWPYHAKVDDEEFDSTDVAFAIQNGPTYGGGFRVCPEAVPNDGRLDLCLTVRKPSLPRSMVLFGLIRFGGHVKSNVLAMRTFQHLEVEFPSDDQPPCQVDGEKLDAERYVVDVVPNALQVITPSSCPW